jgi:anti-sigma regulatory factor (Ser/Thr protein kinase)
MDSNEVELNITSTPRSLPIVRGAVEKMARLEGFSDEDAHALTWAIDEALANVIRHGYNGRPDQPITIRLKPVQSPDGRSGVRVAVRDRGRQVDPQSIKSRDLSQVRPGGVGVHVIQTVMDEYHYSCPPDGGMLLEMTKYVSRNPAPTRSAP